jgi:hypothetical protein
MYERKPVMAPIAMITGKATLPGPDSGTRPPTNYMVFIVIKRRDIPILPAL